MATNKPDKAAVKGAIEPAPAKAERKIPLDKLRKSCVKLFGVTPSTFDGATVGLAGKFSVAEMQEIINKWLNKPIGFGKGGK